MSNYKIDYASLEQSLIDIVQEEQIKLGYRKEKINLFYPASSVNNLLGTDVKSEELYELLKDFNVASTQRLGNVEYTRKGDRFCFIIPESGTEYVHKNANDGGFLKNFIDTISRHGCSIEDIRKIFSEYSDEYTCRRKNMENSIISCILITDSLIDICIV